jgi:hypothetical protein
MREAAQRLALPACGRAWILLWEQEKLEARKMLENAAESHTSGARFVSHRFCLRDLTAFNKFAHSIFYGLGNAQCFCDLLKTFFTCENFNFT